MEFAYFHLMPYTEIAESGTDWPVANKRFDPAVGTTLYNDYIANMAYAEDCGFDWIGCNEHHMSPFGMMANPNLIAAALAQHTKKAKIAVAGNLVPLLNPLRVAEEYAMIDVMTGGRLIAGMFRGIPHEYVAYNAVADESYSRLSEAINFMKRAWTEPEPFGWEGKHYQYRAVSIWPRPVQKPLPRFLMSGSNEKSAELAARHGAMLGVAAVTDIGYTKKLIQVYRDTAKECGWEPQDHDILIGMLCCVGETDKEAVAELEAGRKFFAEVLTGGVRTAQSIVLQKTRYFDDATRAKFKDVRQAFGLNVNDMLERGIILAGSADSVADQVATLKRELGMGVLNVNMKIGNIPNDAVRRSMTLFGERVIPEFRAG
jgi:alkanesulfonate monooxygenase SsuD/methylene tetrahydromethanopterin reductase-like flavin-dependent oxidoreductase (luciferase family)